MMSDDTVQHSHRFAMPCRASSLHKAVCIQSRTFDANLRPLGHVFWKNIVTDMADDDPFLWGIQSETLSARLVAHYPHTHITHVTFMRITCSGLRHAGPIIRYHATDVNVARM